MIIVFDFQNCMIIEIHMRIDSYFVSFTFFKDYFFDNIFTNDEIHDIVFILK